MPLNKCCCRLVEKGYRVIDLDASERLLDLAQQAVPEMTLLRGDMRHADLDGPFDALVAWDSVFHVACSEQGALFHKNLSLNLPRPAYIKGRTEV